MANPVNDRLDVNGEENPAYLPSYEEVCRNRSESNVSTVDDDTTTVSFEPDPAVQGVAGCFSKKRLFIGMMVISASVLISGVVLGIISMHRESLRLLGMLLILTGVLGTVCSAPCCFYMIMNVDVGMRPFRRRRSSAESSNSQSPLPATVEDIFPGMARSSSNVVDGVHPASSSRTGRRDREGRSASLSRYLCYPPYEPPPPYSAPQSDA